MNDSKILRPTAYALLGLCMIFAIPAGAQTLTPIPAIKTFKDTGTGTVPLGLAADSTGNVYFTDIGQNVVRKVDATGAMTVVAGVSGTSGSTGNGGPATAALLNQPFDVILDAAGNLYIADMGNRVVRAVNMQTAGDLTVFGVTIAPGEIETVVGSIGIPGPYAATSVPGAGILGGPSNLLLDKTGQMYITDTTYNVVRKVDTSGAMGTVVGTGSPGSSGINGPANLAQLNDPLGIAGDARGNLYIADSGNNRVLVVNYQSGPITVFGVTVASGNIASVNNLVAAIDVLVDATGSLYLANLEAGTVVFSDVWTGVSRTFAGSIVSGNDGDDGPATAAEIQNPGGLAFDPLGNLYIADGANHKLWRVATGAAFGRTAVGATSASEVVLVQFNAFLQNVATPTIPLSSGAVSEYTAGAAVCSENLTGTFCSIPVTFHPRYPGIRRVPLEISVTNTGQNYTVGLSGVGLGPQATLLPGTITTLLSGLTSPAGIASDSIGNVYVADATVVRKIQANNLVTVFAGTTGVSGSTGDSGAATAALLGEPNGLAVDAAGNVYIADRTNDRVRKVDVRGVITTFAGGGVSTADSVLATDAQILSPAGVAVNPAGDVYITTNGGKVYRVIAATGVITTLIDIAANLTRIDIDAAGNLYVGDYSDGIIIKVNTSGTPSTFAGGGSSILDGASALDAELTNPVNAAVDAAGNLYISEYGHHTVRKLDAATRTISTVAGTFTAGSLGDAGPASSAMLDGPHGVTMDSVGNLYIVDYNSGDVRKITATAATQNFPLTAINATSPDQKVTLANIGNRSLTLTNLTVGTQFGRTAGTSTCDTTTTVLTGGSCVLALNFAPTSGGSKTAVATATGNSLNVSGSAYTVALTSPLSPTSTTILSSVTPVTYGVGTTFTATVVLASTTTPVTAGTVTFFDTTTSQTLGAPVSLNVSGQAESAVFLAAGTHAVRATYNADPAYVTSTSATTAATINKKTLNVTGDNKVRTYGGANPAFTATVSGFVLNDNGSTNNDLVVTDNVAVSIGGAVTGAPGITSTADPATSAAMVPAITPATGTLVSANYAFNFVAGQLSIFKAPLVVTAHSQSRAYGVANPTLDGTITGFVNNDNNGSNSDLPVTNGVAVAIGGDVTGAPSITTTATPGTSITPPPAITAAAGSMVSDNYAFTFVPSTLTIGSVPLSVVVDAKTKVYGAALPALTGVVTGLVGGDTAGTTVVVSYATTGTANSAVSATYPITATVSGTASGNYTLTNTPAALTVTAAPLSVVVQNKTKAYGEAVPALTGTVTGLAGGDTEGTTILVSYSTTGTPSSPVAGTYPITAAVSGTALGNYTLTNTAGTLTVTMGNQTISFAPLERRTPTEAAFAVSATGGGSSSPVMFASATPPVCTVEGNMVTLAGSGTCTIGASQSGDANYNAALSVSQSFIVACNLTGAGSAPCSTTSTGYSFEDGGGTAFTTVGKGGGTAVGYGIVDPDGTTAAPAALAIFGYTANGVLVTEAGVPAMEPVLSGRMYAEFDGPVNTGVAFANPNSGAATIAFYFTDQAGAASGEGSFVLEGGDHISRFLDQPPFNKAGPFSGTLTFTASVPVGVISLRAFTNERSDFTVTTQTIAPTVPDASGLLVMAQYADGGGWKTQVLLVNSSEQAISGTVQFFNEGSGSTGAEPIVLTINGAPRGFVEYTIPARASVKMETGNTGAAVQIGSVRVTPQAGSSAPSGFTLFQFANNGVTAALASVPGQQAGTEYRTYVESRGVSGAPGSIRSGVAIANVSGSPAVVDLELTPLGGGTAFTGTVTVPANGHIAKLIDELLPAAPLSLRGVLKISSGSSPIVVTGLRTRYNERSDFLITTTPAINEATPPSSAALVFPHIVNISGYTMEFILFSGSQAGEGAVLFFDETGAPMTMADQ